MKDEMLMALEAVRAEEREACARMLEAKASQHEWAIEGMPDDDVEYTMHKHTAEGLTDQQLQILMEQWQPAAVELLALRAELSGAREVLTEYDKVVDALRAENERLREALETVRP